MLKETCLRLTCSHQCDSSLLKSVSFLCCDCCAPSLLTHTHRLAVTHKWPSSARLSNCSERRLLHVPLTLLFRLKSACAFHLLTNGSVHTEGPCCVWPPRLSDSTLHLLVTCLRWFKLDSTPITADWPIWKSTCWIWIASVHDLLTSVRSKFQVNLNHHCQSSWTSTLFL